MAKWGFPDMSAEVERLRVVQGQLKASRDEWRMLFEMEQARAERLRVELEQARAELHLMKTAGIIEVAVRNPSVMDYIQHWEGRTENAEARADRLQAERDDLAARLQSIQQAERKYTAAKLNEAAKMRKGQAI